MRATEQSHAACSITRHALLHVLIGPFKGYALNREYVDIRKLSNWQIVLGSTILTFLKGTDPWIIAILGVRCLNQPLINSVLVCIVYCLYAPGHHHSWPKINGLYITYGALC